MVTDKNIDIDLLSIDLNNFRLGEYEDVRAAYRAMLDEQKEKLVNLASDILENGLSPAERLIVVPDADEPGCFIVCEGNRRLTAIRMMADPQFAAGTLYYSGFVRLSKQFQKFPITTLPCTVLPNKDAAFIWIERKHNPNEGKGLAVGGAGFLRTQSALPKGLEQATRGRTSNLDRVFQMPYMASAWG